MPRLRIVPNGSSPLLFPLNKGIAITQFFARWMPRPCAGEVHASCYTERTTVPGCPGLAPGRFTLRATVATIVNLHAASALVSTQVWEPMFLRLRRPMCGRSSTFREPGSFSRGCAPRAGEQMRLAGAWPCKKSIKLPPSRRRSREGHSPSKTALLPEGRRPSAHRAAQPQEKHEETCVDTNAASAWHPGRERLL